MGCILALAMANMYPGSVKSLTLIAPTLIAPATTTTVEARALVPPAESATPHPPALQGLLFYSCTHRPFYAGGCRAVYQQAGVPTFLVDGLCHTHNAAWHTLHNVVCGSAGKLEGYLDDGIQDRCTTVGSCEVNVFHGQDDEVVPVKCSYVLQLKIPQARVNVINSHDHIPIIVGRAATKLRGQDDEVVPVKCSYVLQLKIPQARVNVINSHDHITIIVGRAATELEQMWMRSSSAPITQDKIGNDSQVSFGLEEGG
ncbi:hypothetical protein Syun_003410 [Stephania yunnanensis]|uniref:Uncharacterized protein n=1 Tax=Stephania yunnanensis TaxID=152371 RepID=A0AAP0L146_9MAGN